ncbi:unnamed protein product [Clonostachys rosea f. rosea IK726]|uniref:Uncharacterized protein n=1 Tax=Clonostachys rosea f. rosea IK726 TaxID=1349383 RepID=A0ACA9T9M4_BIOOC|nr:unnamed protein product [Clonostachys rosea f. rosea IK726]
MPKFSAATSGPYFVVGATERLYKVCGEAANYHITEEERNSDKVVRLDDGEEVGTSIAATSVWHKKFKLRPTFSTWSHVTMLHLYLLNARVRCFERDVYRRWQQQLIDHFFFEAEKKMHVDHHITSSALRQRYLKDIFVQWRGLLLAYDEGLIKGDAILASAVWRNLFKGDPDADPRHRRVDAGQPQGPRGHLGLHVPQQGGRGPVGARRELLEHAGEGVQWEAAGGIERDENRARSYRTGMIMTS